MPHDTDALHPLPDDAVSLKRRLAAAEGEVQRLKLVVDKLTLQLARRLRSQFGASSERFDDGQASLIEPAVLDEVPKSKAPPSAAANSGTRDRGLPEHLPREQQEIRPETSAAHHDSLGQPCGCTACGGRLRTLGTDVAHHLEYVPGRFKVVRTVRPKLACTKCEAIFQAPAPVRPIPRGLAGAGLLAHVSVSKYCDHIPLYRLSRIFARDGVEIDRATMAGWIEQVHALLDPLVAALGRHVLQAAKVHADDTPVKVLAPGNGKTRTGRLWVYVRDDRPAAGTDAPAAWYRYSPDRKGEHPRAHLGRFSGTLQADAYGGWNGCTTAAGSPRPPAGHMRGGPGGICTTSTVTCRAWRRRRCGASRRCTPSRPRSEASRRMCGERSAAHAAILCGCCRRAMVHGSKSSMRLIGCSAMRSSTVRR